MITKTIDRNFSNMRLDRFLRKAFPNEPLSVFFAVLRKKKVRVNGKVAKANLMLEEGDLVQIYENFKSLDSNISTPQKPLWGKKPTYTSPEYLKENLDIVLESEDYIVVNKPSGVPSQPGSGTRPGESLVEMLWEWGKNNDLDFKPTIAHRLDQETSGLLVCALHGDTLRELTKLIREHKVDKYYLALVKGNLKKERGSIRLSLSRTNAPQGSKVKVTDEGQVAVTHYSVKQHFQNFDLVKIKLETGKMHQIRAHFAALGHPLAGDTRYGDFALNRELKKSSSLNRLFLHSTRLEFDWKGKHIVVDSALPKELLSVLQNLK